MSATYLVGFICKPVRRRLLDLGIGEDRCSRGGKDCKLCFKDKDALGGWAARYRIERMVSGAAYLKKVVKILQRAAGRCLGPIQARLWRKSCAVLLKRRFGCFGEKKRRGGRRQGDFNKASFEKETAFSSRKAVSCGKGGVSAEAIVYRPWLQEGPRERIEW